MAVKAQDPNQEQDNQSQYGQAVGVSGSSAGSGAPRSPQNTGTPEATSSGRFTNLQKYLNANKDYNQSNGGLAGQINQNLSGQASSINNTLKNSQNDFNTQSQDKRVQWDPNYVNQAVNNPENQDVDKFAGYRDAQYKGPTTMDPNHTLNNAAQNYQNLANQSQTEGGRYSLLKNMFGTPTYTSGQQNLDNAFLQNNPNQISQLRRSAAGANQLYNNVNQQIGQSQQQAQNYGQEAALTQQNTRDALDKSSNDLVNNVNTRLTNDNAAQNQAYQDLITKLPSLYGTSGQLSQEQINSIPKPTDATFASVTSPQEAAKIAALQKLYGPNSNHNIDQAMSSLSDPSQFNTYKPWSVDFNKLGLPAPGGSKTDNASGKGPTISNTFDNLPNVGAPKPSLPEPEPTLGTPEWIKKYGGK